MKELIYAKSLGHNVREIRVVHDQVHSGCLTWTGDDGAVADFGADAAEGQDGLVLMELGGGAAGTADGGAYEVHGGAVRFEAAGAHSRCAPAAQPEEKAAARCTQAARR